ncbi:MAG: hypothetical protein GY847_02050 [Proteobacteria bacterium]|nr:hypothetical protein [Pseudomonadota bacterium]
MENDEQMGTNAAVVDTPDRPLRIRYIVGLMTVSFFACLFAIIVQYTLHEQELDSRVINIAGRQRMLSQKLTKIALTIKGSDGGGDTEKHINEMRDVLELWSCSHRALQQGDRGMGLPATKQVDIIEQFESIEPSYQMMYRACRNIIASFHKSEGNIVDLTMVDKNVNLILSTESRFLEGMNEIVYSFDENAKSKILTLKRTEWILTALILGVLAMVAFLVFEPAVRLIRCQFDKLSLVAGERKRLIDELQEALATVKQLKGLLPICASCKKIRNDDGDWTRMEIFIEAHSDAQFSHGLCQDCAKHLYPDLQLREESAIDAHPETTNKNRHSGRETSPGRSGSGRK